MIDLARPTASAVENAMRRFRPAAFVAVLAASVSSPAALAQSCAGFTDVLATSAFCSSVEWIGNRGITTGCTATTYCPNNAVTRLAMAAFLKRLGEALTPFDLAPVTAAGSTVTPGPNQRICVTPDYAVTAFPRRAYVNAAAVVSAPTAGIDVKVDLQFSVNGGTTWTALNGSDQYAMLQNGLTPADRATLAPFGAVDLNVGQTVRFAVRIDNFGGSGNVTAGCHNRVQIANRNGTSSPFDAASAPIARVRSH